MKKIIRLTEGDLHRIVKESVSKVLTELDWRTYANAARKRAAQADSVDDIETRRRLGKKAYDLDRATERALKNQYGANSVVDTKYDRQDFNTYDTNDPFNFSTDYSTRGAESYKEYDPYGGPYSDDKNRYKGSKEISDFVKGKNKYIKGQGWQ